ncbi:MAG: hypothetical protein A2528_00995 [Candidatus Staskawiczbacteria bacterium RIFOXYD2_FULL_37_9]|uniref:Transcriptional repressor PaaX-like central Cas2-like domain-containing protein n=1 Tax=Candidatus Staskawiczbacteria bacterium RIFOXYB1_FULL_37_44 TaxID=1802223 RepID=A0A1G2IX12_9BACT|nr:MAG: hypothetical protein A2358_00160 [Candidatus Staskawiczbacteria bacterium RIFOXYB1_FULL_37_44]OGZ83708.1 MAG: hypothetical protein A2416_03850 [Candidatus Staskawiczbacteria bacterium RIFOXYC1_FULL_37_52]OGZ90232.1 MAG: hypothetical protein A2581_02380 [Candidatus Staskawiczbacteria bacterium RIFOXYD1_FULL_37_110]OGZ93362.1 MAG: hypothetical protein A2528_00995 [Candidatus Staskawiczbacteria bacterium RIFOXYD2_FULL_37_9]
MKITVTDKFLWDVYDFLENANDNFGFVFSGRYPTMVNCLPRDCVVKIYRNAKNRKRFSKLIYKLKTNGYIKVKNLENKKAIILTKERIDRALKASFMAEKLVKRKDGKWVMIIFDIPEKSRKLRNLLRSVLNNLGFKIYQKSVWISPYDVSEKLENALQAYDLESFVKIFIIEKI